LFIEDVTGRLSVTQLSAFTKNRISKNARNDFAFNIDHTCPTHIFTAAKRSIIKVNAVIVKNDAFTGGS
jgi:hypothetical protein